MLTYQFSYFFFILKYLNTTRNKRGSLAKRILLKINLGRKERDFQRLPFHYNAWNMLHVYKIRQFFSAIKLTVQTTYKNLLEMETAVERFISVFPEFSCYSLTHFPLFLCQVRIFCKFTALFDFAVHIVKTGDISQLFCN